MQVCANIWQAFISKLSKFHLNAESDLEPISFEKSILRKYACPQSCMFIIQKLLSPQLEKIQLCKCA